jgi:hypothetical protein
MKRLNPIGSLLGLLMTLILFIGLGFSLFFNRGQAFSPGKVSAKSIAGVTIKGFSNHAGFEKQCSYCHDPLKTNLATKCLECHTDVSEQITSKQGVHTQFTNINECAQCHPEHRGRNFDPTKASFRLFDHSMTGFSLAFHQINYDASPLQCTECHKSETYATVDNQACMDCHSNHEKTFATVHGRDFGSDCLGCHNGVDRMNKFDHNTTGYPLEGNHNQIKCSACHNTANITDTPKDCKSCHAEPSIHKGQFDQTCDTCHSSQGWSPANLDGLPFAHLTTTGFSLALHQTDYSNQEITCTTCHPTDLNTLDIQTCIDCHTQHDSKLMVDHQQQFGSDCMTCHDGVDRLSNFDHTKFFPLDGKHATAECDACHANQVYRGTPSECDQCHKEPDIHAGVFGLKCYYCHSADAWSPSNLRQHNFPLNHGVGDQNLQLQCDACHGSNYIDYTCYSCHDHQPGEITQSHASLKISDQDLLACAKCHPAGTVQTQQPTP